jgi:hypothetical protein
MYEVNIIEPEAAGHRVAELVEAPVAPRSLTVVALR